MTFQTKLTAAEQHAAEAMTVVAVARSQHAVNAPAYAAKGAALADMAISEARGQGSAWGRMYRSMLDLTVEGRAAFRSKIAAHQKEMQAHVKAASEDGKDNPVFATAKRSGMVRLSELTSISKALDIAVMFDPEWPFHYAVGQAREALRSAGKGSNTGPKATPWIDKVKAYLAKNVPEGEWEQAVELVETMAKTAQ